MSNTFNNHPGITCAAENLINRPASQAIADRSRKQAEQAHGFSPYPTPLGNTSQTMQPDRGGNAAFSAGKLSALEHTLKQQAQQKPSEARLTCLKTFNCSTSVNKSAASTAEHRNFILTMRRCRSKSALSFSQQSSYPRAQVAFGIFGFLSFARQTKETSKEICVNKRIFTQPTECGSSHRQHKH